MKKTMLMMCAALAMTATIKNSYAQTCRSPERLQIAAIPQMKNLAADGHYDVLIDALAEELNISVMLVPAGSYGAVIEGVVDGSVDLAELGPGSYALARERGAKITAFASFKKHAGTPGPSTYHSILITRRDSGIGSLEQLRGATVSLVDPASTSGAIIPRAVLQRMTGMPLEAWFERVTFAGSHDMALKAVLSGRVAAAFVSDSRVNDAVHNGRPAKDTLQIVWQSGPIPTDPFVYQADLCPSVKRGIHRVFFEQKTKLQPLFELRDRQEFVPVSDRDYEGILPEAG